MRPALHGDNDLLVRDRQGAGQRRLLRWGKLRTLGKLISRSGEFVHFDALRPEATAAGGDEIVLVVQASGEPRCQALLLRAQRKLERRRPATPDSVRDALRRRLVRLQGAFRSGTPGPDDGEW